MATNFLSESQLETFMQEGVLVVDDFLDEEQVTEALKRFHDTLARFGIDTKDLESTGHNLIKLSSTNGGGGVLDIFYDQWKMDLACNPTLFSWTTQLWKAAYCHSGENKGDLDPSNYHKHHPFGRFDPSIGFAYVDRLGFRLPTAMAQELGRKASADAGKKRSKPIQRGLTPHLDCCPDTLWSDSKWRPIQCFISLSDALEPNEGGFECAPGFHREFASWIKDRCPSVLTRKDGMIEEFDAPCLGQYTHIRPREDADVMVRIAHVPVRRGSVVFWDNRLPHANAYRHLGTDPRAVVYCSFLPDIAKNRLFVQNQLRRWKDGIQPRDQWIERDTTPAMRILVAGDEEKVTLEAMDDDFETTMARLPPLSRKLLGINPWQQMD